MSKFNVDPIRKKAQHSCKYRTLGPLCIGYFLQHGQNEKPEMGGVGVVQILMMIAPCAFRSRGNTDTSTLNNFYFFLCYLMQHTKLINILAFSIKGCKVLGHLVLSE